MLKSQTFTSSDIFTPEDGVTCVRVTILAGGGAGCWFGSGGGAGGLCVRRLFPVSGPVAVTIGAGGTPAAAETYGFQGNGGDSSFGTLVVSGGQGGAATDAGHRYGGNGGNAGGANFNSVNSQAGDGRNYSSLVVDFWGGVEGMTNYAGEQLGRSVFNPGLTATLAAPARFFSGSGGGGPRGAVGGESVNNHTRGGAGTGDSGASGGAASPYGDGGTGANTGGLGTGSAASGHGAGGGGGISPGIGGPGSGGLCIVEWTAPA